MSLEDFMGLARGQDLREDRERAELETEKGSFYNRLLMIMRENGKSGPLQSLPVVEWSFNDFTAYFRGEKRTKKTRIGFEKRSLLPDADDSYYPATIRFETKEYHLPDGEQPRVHNGDALMIEVIPDPTKDKDIMPLNYYFNKSDQGDYWASLQYSGYDTVSGLDLGDMRMLNLLLDNLNL